MKRSRAHRSDDAAAEQAVSAASSPSSPVVFNSKRRRNNPDECCLTCKLRKVKCSGKSGNDHCENCSRLKLACSFAQPVNGTQPQDKVVRITPNGIVTEAGTLRKRAQRACAQCHLHKTKCSGDLPSCLRCQTNDVACEYIPPKRRFANLRDDANSPTPPRVTASSTNSVSHNVMGESTTPSSLDIVLEPSPGPQNQLLKRDVILKHVGAFFDAFFSMPCMGFLHPATIYRMIDDDQLSPHLAAGICSVTAEFVSPGANGRALAARCNEEVEYHVLRNFAFMERQLLVFHVLAAVYNWMSGPLSKVWMWTSTASRMIKCLQLNYEPDVRSSQESYVEREIQRRSVWQIYIIDHFLSGGFEEHLLLPSSSMHIRLPCTDQVFRDGLPSAMETLDKNPLIPSNLGEYSLDACHVRLLTIRSQVLSITKQFADSQSSLAEQLRPEQFMEHVNQFQIALNRFTDSLPELLKLSVASIDAHLYRPDRASYTMLHTWYCQTSIELYSFSLQKLKAPKTYDASSGVQWESFLRSHQEFLKRSQQQAVAYAICLAQTWDYSLQNVRTRASGLSEGIVTLDWMIGACAVDVVTVLLTARKHRLYDNIRGNTSAQMCYMKPINDVLLSSLITSTLKMTEVLGKKVPRAEHYRELIISKMEEFEDEIAGDRSRDSHKVGDQVATSSPTLPGPDNMLPTTPLDAEGSPRSSSRTASISDQFFRRKSTFSYDKNTSHSNALPSPPVMDPPVIPYCLQQARGSSPTGPFPPPTVGNFQPPHDTTFNLPQPGGMAPTLSTAPVFDISMRPNVPPGTGASDPLVYGHCHGVEGHPHAQVHTPVVPCQANNNAIPSYGSPYSYHERSQTPWVHSQGQYHNSYT